MNRSRRRKASQDKASLMSWELSAVKETVPLIQHGPRQFTQPLSTPIACLVDNSLVSVSEGTAKSCHVEGLNSEHPLVHRVLVATHLYVVDRALSSLMPKHHIAVSGLGVTFCHFRVDSDSGCFRVLSSRTVAALEDSINGTIRADMPILVTREAWPVAMSLLRLRRRWSSVRLLNFVRSPVVQLFRCGEFIEYSGCPLAPSTGALGGVRLRACGGGAVLEFGSPAGSGRIRPRQSAEASWLVRAFRLGSRDRHSSPGEWVRGKLGYNHEELLSKISEAEARHEQELVRIADSVLRRGDKRRVVLISGPSSAGKTTFARRLATHISAQGVQALQLSTDDYFYPPRDTPLGPDGRPDFEHLGAVDLGLFGRQIRDLLDGSPTKLARYDFTTKERHFEAIPVQLSHQIVLIIEGLHALNPKLLQPKSGVQCYSVYVDALAHIPLSDRFPLFSSDVRLCRRIVRDSLRRGCRAAGTIDSWESVQRGERLSVFPYRRRADVVFDSSLFYELNVLQSYLRPLLLEIESSESAFPMAALLYSMVQSLAPFHPVVVPRHSLLREFIGVWEP